MGWVNLKNPKNSPKKVGCVGLLGGYGFKK